MNLSAEEIPSLIFWLVALGAVSYATVKIAGIVRDKVETIVA